MKNTQVVVLAIALFYSIYQMSSQTAKSLHFDGVDDQINCGNDSSIQITGAHITLEAMVKFDAFSSHVWKGNIINKEGASPDSGYMLRAGANGVLNFNLGNGSWNEVSTPSNTVAIGVWYHIAASYDGTIMRIYVDGVEVGIRAVSDIDIMNNSSSLYIGNWALTGNRFFNGTIDEVRIWNVARTAEEIAANMDTEITLPQTGLVLYYKFNQGMANGDNTSETTVNDELGANNGILLNFALNGATSNWIGDTTLAISKYIKESRISIFPNPSSDFIKISKMIKPMKYTIFNSTGARVLKGKIVADAHIHIQMLKKGLYFLRLDNKKGGKFFKK